MSGRLRRTGTWVNQKEYDPVEARRSYSILISKYARYVIFTLLTQQEGTESDSSPSFIHKFTQSRRIT